jgi:hypothetical protein
MKALLGAMLMMSTGCAAGPPAEAEAPPHGGTGCDAAPAQKLIGRAASAELGAEALRLTGAGTMRWLPEGSIVTMEYRADRLNIHLDRQNRVARINCG